MFTEQIIEFEFKSPWPHGRTCNPKTGHFYDKTKTSAENLRMNCFLLLKILQKAMYLTFLHLDQVNYKINLSKNPKL